MSEDKLEIKLTKVVCNKPVKISECPYFLGEVLHLDGRVTYATADMTREEIIQAHWPKE